MAIEEESQSNRSAKKEERPRKGEGSKGCKDKTVLHDLIKSY